MRVQYFPETKSLVIQFSTQPSAMTDEIAPGTNVDYDAAGRVVALEFEDATHIDVWQVEFLGLASKVLVAG